MQLVGTLLKNCFDGLVWVFSYHHGRCRFYNSCLLCGNRFERFAKNMGVVVADVGNDGQFGKNDIGAIERTAKPDLDNGKIDFLLCKIEERKSRCNLEKRGTDFFDGGSVLFDKVDNPFFRNHLSIDANPLSEVLQMRRSVEPDTIAGTLQHRCQEVRA